jgi:hypothetical protein
LNQEPLLLSAAAASVTSTNLQGTPFLHLQEARSFKDRTALRQAAAAATVAAATAHA